MDCLVDQYFYDFEVRTLTSPGVELNQSNKELLFAQQKEQLWAFL